jgi:hypothetical protein
MRGMAGVQYGCSRKLNSRCLDIEVMVDTGASNNMIGAEFVEHLRPFFRKMDEPKYVFTANGTIRIESLVDLRLPMFDELQEFIVGPKRCPPLLAVGEYSMLRGYSFIWRSEYLPYIVLPDGRVVELIVRANNAYYNPRRPGCQPTIASPFNIYLTATHNWLRH